MPHIEQLPDEILEYILNNLPPYRDLENCRNVCQRWADVVENVLKYKSLILNKSLVDFNLCWKNHAISTSTGKLFPAPRYSHASILIGNVMYVFGGSSIGGAFNDLWYFDLSNREWFRPISMGSYPNPKANCSLVQHKNNLILFGGWRQTSGVHQPHLLFNELHIYSLDENRWTIKNFTYGPSPIAAHSATIHRDKMVVFGGYCKLENDVQGNTNEVWVLDLKTFVWRKPNILDKRPLARYGHFQVVLDEDRLMIMGGCGGPNNLLNDAWVLNMKNEVWKWEPITIKNKKFTASHMWCNPATVVDKKLVVIGPTPAQPLDLKIPKQQLSPACRLRPAPNEQSQEERMNNVNRNHNERPRQMQRPRSVENRRPEQPVEANPSFNDAAQRLQKSLCIRVQSNFDPNLPRRFNEPIVHGTIKMAAFNVENNSQLPQQIQRERQLENLRRMELKIQRERAAMKRREDEIKKTKRPKTNCLAIFVCDFSNLLSNNGSIEWIEYKNFGLMPGAPEKIILSTLAAGTGELILFGGLQRETNEVATNAIHFLTYPTTVL